MGNIVSNQGAAPPMKLGSLGFLSFRGSILVEFELLLLHRYDFGLIFVASKDVC